jgi:hypothetical protein
VFYGNHKPSQDWIDKHSIQFVGYSMDRDFDNQIRLADRKKELQTGYWRFTVERLIAISSYHDVFSDEKILHVEADVLLMPNFPFASIDSLATAAWIGYGKQADIASILYSPNYETTKQLRDLILKEISLGNLIDMEILYKVRHLTNVLLLPVSNSNQAMLGSLRSRHYSGSIASLENQEIFQGLFDSASIGIWLTGQDPRNRFGFTKVRTMEIINNGAVQIDPSQGTYSLDEAGCLYFHSEDKNRIPIYNLHIHSKETKLFSPNWDRHLREYVELVGNQPRFVKFDALMLLRLIALNAKQKTLIRFFLNMPLLMRLRQKTLNLNRAKK